MKNIVWLASYPKSGNTWFRAFLTNLLHEKLDPADINQLGGGPIFSARPLFDNYLGIQSSDLLPDEIDELRPAIYNQLSANATKTLFIKAHDAYTYLRNQQPLFPSEATLGAIYLIRNPLDIAPSFANHSLCDIDTVIRWMNDPNDDFCGRSDDLPNQLRQHLLGWSRHVNSWLNAKINVHFVRYEDMKLKPLDTFRAAIRFAGLQQTDEEILSALDACAFDKLKIQEQAHGFREKAAKVPAFFRKGEVGSWQDSLSITQAQRLIFEHTDMMKYFGYLGNENELLFMSDLPLSSIKPIVSTLNQLNHPSHHIQKKYCLYGLVFSLPFEFDELPETDDVTDISVVLGSIDCCDVLWETISIGYKANADLYCLTVPNVGQYLVKSGNKIVIDINTGADLEAVKLFLLNSVMSVVLLQRKLLPFWGSVVAYEGNAIALMGRSAYGKSFFAAGLKQTGFQVLSDNLCVLDDNEIPTVYPGYPFLMLWQQGLTLLGETDVGFKRARKGMQKCIYPLKKAYHDQPVPLKAVYLLSPHNQSQFRLESLNGFDKMFKSLDFTYNEPLVRVMGLLKQQHKAAQRITKWIPVKRYHYLSSKENTQQSINFLAQDILENIIKK